MREKIPRQISAGESFGSSMHNALKKWGEAELEHQPKEPRDNQLSLFMEEPEKPAADLTQEQLIAYWHASFIVEGYASREDADAARKRGEQIMKLLYDWWAKKPRTVKAVETGFSWESPDLFTVAGRFDRVEQTSDGVRIIDFKTGAPRTQEEVDTDLQLSIYALAAKEAFGVPCTELSLLFLREDGITEITTERSEKQLQEAISEMDSLVEGIDSDTYPPDPTEVKCDRCPYRGICDAAKV